VMSGFSDQISGVIDVEEVLPRMAEAAARGVGAVGARVTLYLPQGEARTVAWPESSPDGPVGLTLRVNHRGEDVGEIAVAKSSGDPLRPAEEALLRDLAAQAGVALHNVRLAVELRTRLEQIARQASEIRASRQRIVGAQEEERRRLEQAISQGVERQLTRMEEELARAEALILDEANQAAAILDSVGEQAKGTLEDLRELARGIYPPLLADKGLVAALQAQAARSLVPVTVKADAVGRFPEDVEAGVYFCFLEAVNDAVSRGSAISVQLSDVHGGVELRLIGAEPDPETVVRIRDRVEALGGALQVHGAVIDARIPARALEAV
jgi:signal transduction histidine kinase